VAIFDIENKLIESAIPRIPGQEITVNTKGK
jgi:hypothetical protein